MLGLGVVGFLAVDEGAVEHGVGFVGWAVIGVGVVGDDLEWLGGLFGVEAVEGVGRDDPDVAGGEWEFGVVVAAGAVSVGDGSAANGGMGVGGLVDAWWEVEEVEAGVAESGWGEEEGVGAAVDVSEASGGFDRASECAERVVVVGVNGDDACVAGECEVGGSGDREVFALMEGDAVASGGVVDERGAGDDVSVGCAVVVQDLTDSLHGMVEGFEPVDGGGAGFADVGFGERVGDLCDWSPVFGEGGELGWIYQHVSPSGTSVDCGVNGRLANMRAWGVSVR